MSKQVSQNGGMTWGASPGIKIGTLAIFIPVGIFCLVAGVVAGDYAFSVLAPLFLALAAYLMVVRPRIAIRGNALTVTYWVTSTVIDRSDVEGFTVSSTGLVIKRKTGRDVRCYFLGKGLFAQILKVDLYPDRVCRELNAWLLGPQTQTPMPGRTRSSRIDDEDTTNRDG
jgi:hypothetical protein